MVTFLRIPPPSTDIQAGTRESLLSRRRLLMFLSTPSFSLLLLLYRFSVFIYLFICGQGCTKRSEENGQESVFSFHRAGPGDQTRLIRLDSGCLYLRSHHSGPRFASSWPSQCPALSFPSRIFNLFLPRTDKKYASSNHISLKLVSTSLSHTCLLDSALHSSPSRQSPLAQSSPSHCNVCAILRSTPPHMFPALSPSQIPSSPPTVGWCE